MPSQAHTRTTPTEPNLGFYYADGSLVTVSGRGHAIRRDQQLKQSQYAQTLGHDDF